MSTKGVGGQKKLKSCQCSLWTALKAMHYGHLLDAKGSSFKKDKGAKIEAYQQGNMNM